MTWSPVFSMLKLTLPLGASAAEMAQSVALESTVRAVASASSEAAGLFATQPDSATSAAAVTETAKRARALVGALIDRFIVLLLG